VTASTAILAGRQQLFGYRAFSPAQVEELAAQFASAEPFPHLVLENFSSLSAAELGDHYPAPDSPYWNKRRDFYQSGKMYCRDTDILSPLILSMLYELSSPPFLRFLENVTRMSGLIPDPYYEGGGLHCSGPGGVLMPHTDFHHYERLGLHRRVNLLLYLNERWDESFGGCLELWRKGASSPARLVVPRWGTCVIFRTDDQSVHGFSVPVKEGHWRRSIALYYYGSQETARFSGDTTTYWQQHGKHQGLNRLRMRWSRLLTRAARRLAMLAHQANPNKERP
jgi:Rps23 Pro-64 3,4-dihydroxylase Tpa1-like proline 4-hydroxylase